MHQPATVTQTTQIMEPSWIETITVNTCPEHVHQSQHNHGLVNQASHGTVVGNIIGGSIQKIRGIEQSLTIHGAGEIPNV